MQAYEGQELDKKQRLNYQSVRRTSSTHELLKNHSTERHNNQYNSINSIERNQINSNLNKQKQNQNQNYIDKHIQMDKINQPYSLNKQQYNQYNNNKLEKGQNIVVVEQNNKKYQKNDIQEYINKQINKKLSYCSNGTNSKEIYPTQIFSALKTESDINYQTPLKLNQYSSTKKNSDESNEQQQGNINSSSTEKRKDINKNINNISKKRSVSNFNNKINNSQNDITNIDKYIDNKLELNETVQQNNKINKFKYQHNQHQQNKNIQNIQNKSYDNDKYSSENYLNKNENQKNNEDIRSILQRQAKLQVENRTKTETSLQTDYTFQTFSSRSKSPDSNKNNNNNTILTPSPYKQRSFSKKLIEKIKLNRDILNNSNNNIILGDIQQSFQNKDQSINSDCIQQISNHNLQIVQQGQRINKFAEYIKLDTYKLNQELRPNKQKVQELVESILQSYKVLLNLSSDKSRIAKIMKECGATKGRLIEIFFVNNKNNQSNENDDIYYNKYLDTIEKSFNVLKDQSILEDNKTQLNNTIFEDSYYTECKTTRNKLYQQEQEELILVDPLIAKCFYEKTYFKVLQKDSNGLAQVQEYIDLQVIEDLEKLKTTLSFCLKMSEDATINNNVKKSPTNYSPNSNINKSKDNNIKNYQKNEEYLLDIKIKKYDQPRVGVQLIKNQIIKDNIKLVQNNKDINKNKQDILKQQQQQQKQKHNIQNNLKDEIQSNEQQIPQQQQQKVNQNIENSNNNDLQQYLGLLKDSRNERKGIISDMRLLDLNNNIGLNNINSYNNYDSNYSTNYFDYDIQKIM